MARRKGRTLSYFVDGESIVDLTQDIVAEPIGSASEEQDLVIGYDTINPSATRFRGELQELTVWARALPMFDIQNGLKDLDGDENGLIAYFPKIPLDQFGEITSYAKPKPQSNGFPRPPPPAVNTASSAVGTAWP